jgi:hypothetical protein
MSGVADIFPLKAVSLMLTSVGKETRMYYRDANHIEHESYEAACHYYGADTPAQIAAEMEAQYAEEREALMDRMMAGEVQPGAHFLDDEIPF